jgi:hypothetical protein
MGVGHHHGRGSHDKDVSHDLPDWPLWVVEQDEPQDQQRGRKFLFRLAEDWKSKMSGLAFHHLYCRGELKRWFRTPLTVNGVHACTTTISIDPTRRHGKEGDPSCQRLQREWMFFPFLNEDIPTSQRYGATLDARHKSDKELSSLAFFFPSYCFEKCAFQPRAPWYGQAFPHISQCSGAAQIRLASIQEIGTGPLPSFWKERRDNKRRQCPDCMNNLIAFSWDFHIYKTEG